MTPKPRLDPLANVSDFVWSSRDGAWFPVPKRCACGEVALYGERESFFCLDCWIQKKGYK